MVRYDPSARAREAQARGECAVGIHFAYPCEPGLCERCDARRLSENTKNARLTWSKDDKPRRPVVDGLRGEFQVGDEIWLRPSPLDIPSEYRFTVQETILALDGYKVRITRSGRRYSQGVSFGYYPPGWSMDWVETRRGTEHRQFFECVILYRPQQLLY